MMRVKLCKVFYKVLPPRGNVRYDKVLCVAEEEAVVGVALGASLLITNVQGAKLVQQLDEHVYFSDYCTLENVLLLLLLLYSS